MRIGPDTLSQLRLLWSATFPGDGPLDPGCNPAVGVCYLPTDIGSYAFSPDGKTLAIGVCRGLRTEDRSRAGEDIWGCTGESEIVLYDAGTGAELRRFLTSAIPLSLAFQPEGKVLAAGLAHNSLELWDLSIGERPSTLMGSPQNGGTYRLAFSADGSRLVSAAGLQLQVWDWRSAALQMTIENAVGLGLSPNSPRLATLHLGGGGADRIRIYDLTQNGAFVEIPPDRLVPQPTEFSFHPNHGWLATIDRAYGSQVDFWDLESKSVAATFDFRRDYDRTGVLYYFTDDFTPDGYFLMLRAGQLTTPESQPNATGLREALWACGFALLDMEADRTFFTSPMLYDDCAGPAYLYDMAGNGFSQVPSPEGSYIAADDGYGHLRVWGIDPSTPPLAPECSGDCPGP